MNKNENRLMKTAKVFIHVLKRIRSTYFTFCLLKSRNSLGNKAHVIQLIKSCAKVYDYQFVDYLHTRTEYNITG